MFGYEKRKLSFQLVPSTSWYSNVRSIFPAAWNQISKEVRKEGRCEICGTQTDISRLEAHEVWAYDDNTHVQTLSRIVSVCKACHTTMHIGLAQVKGFYEEAMEQYVKVNGVSPETADKEVDQAFAVWMNRSQHDWEIDKEQVRQQIFSQTGISIKEDVPTDGRYYANVSYHDKDEAKKYGARWDPERKSWYFPDKESIHRWNTREDIE